MKKLPFVNKPLEEIEVVGNERTGQLHLVSIKGITPNENPTDFQQQQKSQQKFLLRLTQRIKVLAQEHQIPVKEMRKKVMGAMTSDSNPLTKYQVFVSSVVGDNPEFSKKSNLIYIIRLEHTWAIRVIPDDFEDWRDYFLNAFNDEIWKDLHTYLIETFGESKQWPITENLTDDQISKLKYLIGRLQLNELSGEDDDQIFDYLDEQTAELLFNLQEDKARLAIRAATFMIKHRTVYPILAQSNAVAGTKALHIANPEAPIAKNTSIRFGPTQYVETTEILTPSKQSTVTIHVDELPFEIKDGDVGFLCDEGSRSLKQGYPGWTEDDTRSLLPEELIQTIFEFYQKEAGIVADVDETEDPDDAEGNLLMPSQNQLEQTPSIGAISGTDSNTSVSMTLDSTQKNLVTNQLG